MSVRRRLESFRELPAELATVRHLTSEALSLLRSLSQRPPPAAPPLPPPFVCVLVEASCLRRDPAHVSFEPSHMGSPPMYRSSTTLGATGRIGRQAHETAIELVTQEDLADGRITVFADLERVGVISIRLGRDILTSASGECPVAFFVRWPTGVRLSVSVTLR